MLKFKNIQDFINYRPKCLICNSEMRHQLSSNRIEFKDDYRTLFKDENIILQSQDENLKWYTAFEINIKTNKIVSTLKNDELHKIFIIYKFYLASTCSNYDFCKGHWVGSYPLTLECQDIKLFQIMLAKEDFNIKKNENGEIREIKLTSNYQANKTSLQITGLIDNISTKTDGSPYYNYAYNIAFRQMSRKVIKPYTYFPLISLNDFSSLEEVLNCIDTILMFS